MKIPSDNKFCILVVGALIERSINGSDCVLLQKRKRPDNPKHDGLLEVPSGKVEKNAAALGVLQDRVLKETGLIVSAVSGEWSSSTPVGFELYGSTPFHVCQNAINDYPVCSCYYICEADGEPLVESDAAKDIRWVTIDELHQLLQKHADTFLPTCYSALLSYVRVKRQRQSPFVKTPVKSCDFLR